MVISFVVHNKSEIVQEFEIKMIQDDDTHFLAAGNQMVCFSEHLGVRGGHSVSVTRIVENLSYHCSPLPSLPASLSGASIRDVHTQIQPHPLASWEGHSANFPHLILP